MIKKLIFFCNSLVSIKLLASDCRRLGFHLKFLFQCSFGLAKLLLTHNPALQLGLFVTGCSPGGGWVKSKIG